MQSYQNNHNKYNSQFDDPPPSEPQHRRNSNNDMAFYEKRLLQLIDQSPVYRFATGSYNLLLLGNVLQCYRETFGTDLVLASDEQNGYYDNNTETSLKQFIRNLPRIRVARLPSEQVYVVCKAETARLLGLATDTTEEEILEEEEEELVVEEEEEDSKPRARSPKNNQAENHNSVVNIDSEDQNTNNKEMENLQVEPFMAVIDRVGVPADAEEEKSANDNNNLLHNNHQVEDASSAQASVVLPSVRALPVEERIQKFCEEKLIPSKVYQELEQRLHRFPEGLVASQINQLVPELLYFIREEGRSYLVPPTGSAATVLQACPDIEVKEENGTVHYKLRKEGSSNWQPPPPPAAAAAAAAVAIGLPSPPPAAPQIVRQEKLSASKKKSPPPPPAAAATSAATAVHSPPAPAPSETIALDKDSGAAMEFLRLLRVTFGKAPFPKTTKSLVALLGKHLKKQPNIFSDQWNRWAAAQCKLTKKRNRQVYCDIIRRFLIQYKKMGIVRTNNKDFKTFYWMKARAEGVINNKSLAVAAVAAAASQLARDAQRPVAAAGQADEETQMVTAARQWRNSRNESHPDAHPHSHVHPRQQPPGESAGPSPPSAAFRNSTWTTSSSAAIRLVETMEQLYKAKDELIPSKKRNVAVIDVDEDEEEQRDVWTDHHESVVAVDCEGVPNNIYLLQIGTGKATYLFDCVRLSPGVVCRVLQRLFTDKKIIKFFHDLHKDALALSTVGGLYESLKGTLDTQLAMEALTGEVHMGMNQMLEYLGQPLHATKKAFREKAHEHAAHGSLFRERPLPHDAITYAADDVDLVIKAKHALFNALQKEQPDGLWKSVQTASDLRAEAAVRNNGYRQLGFDVTNSYAIASLELLEVQRPSDLLVPTSLTISNDAAMLVALLPPDLAVDLQDVETQEDLSDIVLDKGRHPHVWANGVRKSIGSRDRLVTAEDLKSITEQLGGFGDDNRAGLERQLHRVSAVRNRKNDIIGLTLRVGRHVTGNAAMISDLLFHYPHRSILFLGEPGSGKTTIIREVTRQLAERSNVCIVDTSNEIAGDGDVPHPCVGFARRMMVPSLDEQSAVMIECVQNHTPEVMVIDEIGRPSEVDAARTCKQRGVRLIASAHGDLRKLVKNKNLCDLVGGVETVTLGDFAARKEADRRRKFNGGRDNGGGMGAGGGSLQKLKATRAGAPTFDIIVELKRGAHNEWRLVLDTGDAVDRIMEGRQYLAQVRTRDPYTGRCQFELIRA